MHSVWPHKLRMNGDLQSIMKEVLLQFLWFFRGKTLLTTEGSRWLTKHGFQSILQSKLFLASHCPLVNFSGLEQSKKMNSYVSEGFLCPRVVCKSRTRIVGSTPKKRHPCTSSIQNQGWLLNMFLVREFRHEIWIWYRAPWLTWKALRLISSAPRVHLWTRWINARYFFHYLFFVFNSGRYRYW